MSDSQKSILNQIEELKKTVFSNAKTDIELSAINDADHKICELYEILISESMETYIIEQIGYLYSYITSGNTPAKHEDEFRSCIGALSYYPDVELPNELECLELYIKIGVNPGALRSIADRFYGNSDYERAIRHYDAFFNMDPEHKINSNNEIAWITYVSAIKELYGVEAAISAFRDVIKHKPASAKVRDEAAKLLIENKLFEEALDVCLGQMLNKRKEKYYSPHYYWNAISLIDQSYTGLNRDDALERIFNCDALLIINRSVEAAVGTVDDVVALNKEHR